MSSTQEQNEERLADLEFAEYGEWVVFTINAVAGKLKLEEVATVRAVDAELAILNVAEANPMKATNRMCAFPATEVTGRRVKVTHHASIVPE